MLPYFPPRLADPLLLFIPPAPKLLFHKEGTGIADMADLIRGMIETGDVNIVNNKFFLSFSLPLFLSLDPPSP